MRILAWLKVIVIFFVLLAATGWVTFSSDWFQREYIYPFTYKDLIYEYAQKNDLDPHLVAAIVRTESKFIPTACSPKGALGLMQIMPDTGKWVAGELGYSGFSEKMLIKPQLNLELGTWYYASLRIEFHYNDVLALAAYNAGRGNVNQWIKQFGWTDDFKEISQIPFRETREYVAKVLNAKKRYDDLYGQ